MEFVRIDEVHIVVVGGLRGENDVGGRYHLNVQVKVLNQHTLETLGKEARGSVVEGRGLTVGG